MKGFANSMEKTWVPFLTVVVPTYNRTDFVLRTLLSVKRQTFTDFECLVIDDGSHDGERLAALVASLDDNRFKYIRQENRGAPSARNRGFDLARGPYIALLDSDDSFLPGKLQKCADIIREVPGEVLIYSQMIVERGLEKQWIRPSRGHGYNERVDEYLLCTPGTMRTSTVVVSTTLARRIRFDESLPSLQDTDFAIRSANAGATFIYIAEPLVIFEDRASNTRISRNQSYQPLLEWLERLRAEGLSERAYWAGRGGQCARIASYSNRTYAIWLYLQSALRGAFPLGQAVILGAQVAIPYWAYQKIANLVVSIFGWRDPRRPGVIRA
ncbi:glycosyltransferase family 2 protein [Mycolicibacterium holsaticum]|uniref:glycosyltransferase family 2 protein n=1 Tax=Mycolicibacterium holsaticum TaxID=152142 RepID=UPI0009FBAC64|nr:glycosyltransferase [Mycolicibacterium holsaticum]